LKNQRIGLTNELLKNSQFKISKHGFRAAKYPIGIFEIQYVFGYNEAEERSKIHASQFAPSVLRNGKETKNSKDCRRENRDHGRTPFDHS
jgi:hypothetical protein